jgi:homoserine dehydrogenase
VGRSDIEVRGLREIELEDLLQARGLGGRIKLIAHAAFVGQRIEAFVGPTFVPDRDLLAGLSQEQNGIRLYGQEIGKLFYTGPGAGRDVTAGTLLDDVVEVLAIGPSSLQRLAAVSHGKGWECVAPTTPWFLRLVFRKGIPAAEEISEFLAAQGIWFWKASDVLKQDTGDVLYALTHKAPRERVAAALAALREASYCDAEAFRVLEDA